ncbi:MAG: hypothetical protein HQ521_10270 [Bacteroidetes bacterium]|nr:hypothetical protein [Bacteroidota bacterium]
MKTLFEFERFPLSVCTQDGDLSPLEEMIPASICEDDFGLISFLPYVDPKKIYLSQHNSSIGPTWTEHNKRFAEYVYKVEKHAVTDIGGGSGNIYKSYLQHNTNVNWKIIDLNPTLEDRNVQLIKGLYDSKYISKGETVITSHFLEHQFDFKKFLSELRMREPKYHIFSLPNFKYYAKNKYLATIMFEHPHYLEEDYLDHILKITGWKILNKAYFNNHSIFYTTEPTKPTNDQQKFDCKDDIVDLIEYYKKRVEKIKHLDGFYVFGAHFTYYYLLNFGIKEIQIKAVVDNDVKKQNRRMYGTNTKTISSDELPNGAMLFLEMGPYNEEISRSLKDIVYI